MGGLLNPITLMEHRIAYPERYPGAYLPDPNGRDINTHLMSAEYQDNGPAGVQPYAFPMVVLQPNGQMKRFEDPQRALQWNIENQNAKPFSSIYEADHWSQNYKTSKFNDYWMGRR